MSEAVTVTAYGRDALHALRSVVADAKSSDPMAPVTVVVPNNIAGIVARRHLARGLVDGGNGVAGIWFTTLPRLAELLAAPTLTGQGRRPATRPVVAAALRQCLDADPGSFDAVAEHPATALALATASRRLRDLDDAVLDGVAGASGLAADVVRIHRQTVAALAPRWYDATDLLLTATTLIGEGRAATAELGMVVIYLPQDLSRAESALAAALADRCEVRVVTGMTGAQRADLAPLTATQTLATPPEVTGRTEPTATRVLTASDSDDEVRCVVREVLGALATTPAHRVAVLYSSASPYARLLHEHLTAAGVVVNGPGVRPVSERALPRMLMGLLASARTGYARADVMRALGETSVTGFDGQWISVPRWERVSREAGVVGGGDWDARLATHIERLEHAAADDTATDATIERSRRTVEAATSLREFMLELQGRFLQAASLQSWSDLAAWSTGLLDALVSPTSRQRLPYDSPNLAHASAHAR